MTAYFSMKVKTKKLQLFCYKNAAKKENGAAKQIRPPSHALPLGLHLHHLSNGVSLTPIDGINTQLQPVAPLRFRLCNIKGIALHFLHDIYAVSQPHTINAHGRLDKRVYAHAFNWHIDFFAATAENEQGCPQAEAYENRPIRMNFLHFNVFIDTT